MSDIFTVAEYKVLIAARIEGAGEKGVSKTEIDQWTDWAEEVKINNAIVDLALEGSLLVDAEHPEVPCSWLFRTRS